MFLHKVRFPGPGVWFPLRPDWSVLSGELSNGDWDNAETAAGIMSALSECIVTGIQHELLPVREMFCLSGRGRSHSGSFPDLSWTKNRIFLVQNIRACIANTEPDGYRFFITGDLAM